MSAKVGSATLGQPQAEDGSSEDSFKCKVACTLPVLTAASTQLKETSTQIESAVVEVCERFQSVADRARSGVSGATELIAGNKSSGCVSVESLIDDASSTFETLMCHAADSAAISNSAIERIVRVRESTDKIAASLSQLDEITVGSRLLAVNARIQAVHAGDKAAGFGGVANEIALQAKRSSEIVEMIRLVSSELRQIADSALADLRSMVAEDQKAYESSTQQVVGVFEKFRIVHGSTKDFVEKVRKESHAVAAEIAGAIHVLQFQCRINQRIGHVVAEVDRIKADLSADCSDIDFDSRNILAPMAGSYTMHEERTAIGHKQSEPVAGEVEFF